MRAVLTYHSIDASGSPISVAPAAFARHVEWLASGAVRVVTLDDLIRSDEPGEEDRVAITFDDGLESVAAEAVPRLVDHGLRATVFVVTDHAGGANAWGGRAARGIPTFGVLDWPALGRLSEQGMEIGSHTRTHPRLPGVSDAALEDELDGSAERIGRELGRRPGWLAYPYGAVSAREATAARSRYHGAVTTEYRPLGPRLDRHRVPRLDAWYFQAPDALARWNTARFRRRVWLRRQARRARAAWTVLAGVP